MPYLLFYQQESMIAASVSWIIQPCLNYLVQLFYAFLSSLSTFFSLPSGYFFLFPWLPFQQNVSTGLIITDNSSEADGSRCIVNDTRVLWSPSKGLLTLIWENCVGGVERRGYWIHPIGNLPAATTAKGVIKPIFFTLLPRQRLELSEWRGSSTFSRWRPVCTKRYLILTVGNCCFSVGIFGRS